MSRTIEVTMKFCENDLDRLLSEIYFGDNEAPRARDLTDKQFELFRELMQSTSPNFVEDVIDTARDAAASDWMSYLTDQFA